MNNGMYGVPAHNGEGLDAIRGVKVYERLLTAPCPNLDIHSIPPGFSWLKIRANLRSTQNAASTDCNMQFNLDVGSNYHYFGVDQSTSSLANTNSSGQTSLLICTAPGATATGGTFADVDIEFYHYCNQFASKVCFIRSSNLDLGTSTLLRFKHFQGQWSGAASRMPVSRILMQPVSGSFDAGSRVSVWAFD